MTFRERKQQEHFQKTGQWKTYDQIRRTARKTRATKITSKQKDEKAVSGLDEFHALQKKGKKEESAEDIQKKLDEALIGKGENRDAHNEPIKLAGGQSTRNSETIPPQGTPPPVRPTIFKSGGGSSNNGGGGTGGGAGSPLTFHAIYDDGVDILPVYVTLNVLSIVAA